MHFQDHRDKEKVAIFIFQNPHRLSVNTADSGKTVFSPNVQLISQAAWIFLRH